MGFISWLILGLVAGFIASKIINKSGEGLIMEVMAPHRGAGVTAVAHGPQIAWRQAASAQRSWHSVSTTFSL